MIEEHICYIIIFTAEAFIAWIYFEYLFSHKTNRLFCFVSFLFGYLTLYAISLVCISALNTISFCVITFLLAHINYDCSTKAALLHASFLTFIMAIAEILMALVISLFGNEFTAYSDDITILIAMAITSKILYLVLSVASCRLISPRKHRKEDPGLMILFCGLPLVSSAVAILVIYIGANAEMNTTTRLLMTINVFALLIVNIVFLVLYNYSQRMNEEYTTLQLSLLKDQADATFYQTLQDQSESQRILIHDIKNHLHTIDGLACSGNTMRIRDYISKLELAFQATIYARICSNPILNMMVSHYQEECIKKGIRFSCDIRDQHISFIDAPSITSIFGNLLSNAIEAAEQSTEKSIELYVSPNDLYTSVVISIINSCDTPPQINYRGKYITHKKDSTVHGTGLKSIDRAIRKYGGESTMYFDPNQKQFHHIIHIPLAGGVKQDIKS